MRKLALTLALGLLCAPFAPRTARADFPVLRDTPDEQIAAASDLYEKKKYEEAAAKLDAFLAANPNDSRFGAAALTLGYSRAAQFQWQQAIAAYQKAIDAKSSGENGVQTQARLGLAEAAIQTKQYEKASDALTVALQNENKPGASSDPNENNEANKVKLTPEQAASAWYRLGQADFALKRYDAAQEAFAHVTRNYSTNGLVAAALFESGLAALRQDKNDVAAQRFRNVVARYPRSEDRPQAELLVAQLDFGAQKYNQARAGFEDLLGDPNVKGMTPEIQQAAEDGLVQTLLAVKDYDAASSRLEKVIARLPADDPERFRAHYSLAQCRYQQKQYAPALVAFQEASKSSDKEVAANGLYWAANASLALDKPADAATQFTDFAIRYPQDKRAVHAQLRAGDSWLAAKQNDSAARAYRTLISKFSGTPEVADARKALADIRGGITDPTKLAESLKEAQGEEKTTGLLRLARLYLAQKQYPNAAATLTQLRNAKPDGDTDAEAAYLLGLAYEGQSKGAQAITAFSEAIKLRPMAAWAGTTQARLAWLYLDAKQPAQSETAANAALAAKLDAPTQEQTRLALIQSQIDQQKWEAALENGKTLLASNPAPETAATVVFTQAFVSEKQNKTEEAQALWEKLTTDYPKSDYAPEALLRLGNAQLKTKNYDAARERYAKLISDYPKSALAPEARYQMGTALFNLDKYGEAADAYVAVADDKTAGPLVPQALYWAGAALDKADKKSEAIARLTTLVTKYPTHALVPKAKIRLAGLKSAGN